MVVNQELTKQSSDDYQGQSFSLRSRKLRIFSVLLMSLTRIWMLNWVKTYVYLPIIAMENVLGIVREGFLRVKSWRSLCAITSVHIVISRSIIRTVYVAGSGINFLQPYPIIVLWKSCLVCSSKMMLFIKLYALGKSTAITFVDSTMIPVCNNVRRYFNKVFSGFAKNG